MSFAHLHLHTEYSLLDGACRIESVITAAKSMGQTSIAITDHGVMYGVVDFYKEAKRQGIKAIIGCEVYVAARTRFDKQHSLDSESNHLVLLCKNQQGYNNLMKIVSLAFTEGFYSRPRVDKELLEQYSEGLIALSACLAGEIPRALMRDDYAAAKKTAFWYRDVFGSDNFFLEVQNHGIPEQARINPMLLRLSSETGIQLVATNDVHYVEKSDSRIQQVLMCIATNTTLLDEQKLGLATKEFYLKSESEMNSIFSNFPNAVANTAKIAERCNVEFEFGNTKLPRFEIGEQNHTEYMRHICETNIPLKYGDNPSDEVYSRLEYEMNVIDNMGYVDYFLIVYDFVKFARDSGIPVGPGRGSGAGSLCAYLMGITGIDPIKYQLLFERFLNPERVSMPDFDIDFCYVRRQEVINYVVKKYGEDHVAQIVTFGTLAARAAIRDVGRALGVPYSTCDHIAKLVPMELGITVEQALIKSAELKNKYDSDLQIRDLIDTALKVEGMPRHASTHAAGVVITDDPVSSYVPLAKNDEAIVAQFPMTTLEELGLLKMDFLGLRYLTVVYDAEKLIHKFDKSFSIDNVPLDDNKVFKMLTKGHTSGIFQFESAGMKSVLMRLGPVALEDLIAVISLFRPGPMDSIPKYIKNRHNPKGVRYLSPLLEPILNVTYGCLVYQEQVMQVFRSLGGYSLGRADIVRRAMSKKKQDVMERERNAFIHGDQDVKGAVSLGVPPQVADKIFDEMSSFASYAFNKSHAAAYAYLSYQTAYLKAHYPKEYFAALLTSVLHNTSRISEYIAECQRLSIAILPPDVNKSDKYFTVEDDGIRFSLLAIKNLGEGFIDSILAERNNGIYTSLYEFCDRIYGRDMNRRGLESLVKCGATDSLSGNRRQNLEVIPQLLDILKESHKFKEGGQIGLFDTPEMKQDFILPIIEDMSTSDKLSAEKETTGMYLSGHPMEEYRETIRQLKTSNTAELLDSGQAGSKFRDNDRTSIVGIITELRLKSTKNNSMMAYIKFEDFYSEIEVIVFPKTLSEQGNKLTIGQVVRIDGKISLREDRDVQLICERVSSVVKCPINQNTREPQKSSNQNVKKNIKTGLYLRTNSLEGNAFKKAMNIMSLYAGETPVYVLTTCDSKKMLAPKTNWVNQDLSMLNKLGEILGKENVKLVK